MKTKIILILFLISFAGLFAQQKAKLQKVDESGFIEVDKAPELISKLNPEYPKLAKLAGIEGTVYLKLLIDEKGNVAKAKVEQGVKDMIDESALKAAKKAKFSPAILNNKPLKVWVVLPIAFKLALEKKESTSNISDEDPDPNVMIQYEKAPELIESAKPIYPEEAKKNNITGKVFVKVLIDKEGLPKRAMVIKSESQLFNQSAVDDAMKSKFTPAMDKGNPIAVWVVLPYKFELSANNMESKSFDKLEDAEKYYQGYIKGLIGNGSKAERIENTLSYGDESALYKIIGDSYDKYSFIARKGLNVVMITMNTLDDLKLAVNKNMDNTFNKLEVKRVKRK